MERIILNLKQQSIAVASPSGVKVLLAYLGPGAKEAAMELGATLRRAGITALSSLGDRSLKAQLRQANALGVAYALILGEDELETGTVLLRDMAEGEQRRVATDEAISILSASKP
jgi:histidyl-tRNA synthetase